MFRVGLLGPGALSGDFTLLVLSEHRYPVKWLAHLMNEPTSTLRSEPVGLAHTLRNF